jgi:hypothetical protein
LKFVTTNPIRDQVWAELLTNIKEERETWSISNKKKRNFEHRKPREEDKDSVKSLKGKTFNY